MQINNSLNANQIVPSTKSRKLVDNQQDSQRIKFETEKELTNDSNEQGNTRFDVDEQALQLVAQHNSGQQAGLNQSKSSSYDQPSEFNHTAVSAYQSIDNLAQRDNIKKIFGVDLFA